MPLVWGEAGRRMPGRGAGEAEQPRRGQVDVGTEAATGEQGKA